MYLYFVRHGDPDYEKDCLTDLGKEQAELVSKRLALIPFDRIYTSSMGRAKETAAPTCRIFQKEPVVLDWAKEITGRVTMPDGEEKSLAALSGTYFRGEDDALPFGHSFENSYFAQSGLQEKFERVVKGGLALLKDLGYEEENGKFKILYPNEEHVVIFGHGNVTRSLLSYLLHIPLHIMWAGFRYGHTGVTMLYFKNETSGYTVPKCLYYADMSHLNDGKNGILFNKQFYI